jgi:hypothetical protein
VPRRASQLQMQHAGRQVRCWHPPCVACIFKPAAFRLALRSRSSGSTAATSTALTPAAACPAALRPLQAILCGPELASSCLASEPPIWGDIFRFLRNPHKPVVLAMSRPDAKKNLTTLVGGLSWAGLGWAGRG